MQDLIFCKDRFDQNWIGDDFGSFLKFCSDFFPLPTDNGICLSKNLDYKQLINTNEEFKTVFETGLQYKFNELVIDVGEEYWKIVFSFS